MYTTGILGAGRVGATLAGKLAEAGHDVTVGTRSGTRPDHWSGPQITFADHGETARRAEIVINATPGESTLERLTALREPLAGKLLIDISNATRHGADGMPGGLLYPDASLAEHLQDALPATRVVKTLNTMLFTVMAEPRSLSVPPTAFLSGNDPDAKKVVSGLLGDLGWESSWLLDLGDVSTARATEALILLVPHVIRSRGFAPFAFALAS
ncbi:NADPH-dependent F420 reductase [Amycolatopsis pithecellobii]|uniref:NADP oxidoreductase n=1 Tax=Amycolatopsis pithecellobii TaxID=664692 RepID=A0A6N7YTI0_9PSEU|nr:NAD(P)-binding domain-containing protein [Amycolatopsis pithecellobii]MTD55242.1 NADP oxidoreductase [Amycolatopsis pithecellobii]